MGFFVATQILISTILLFPDKMIYYHRMKSIKNKYSILAVSTLFMALILLPISSAQASGIKTTTDTKNGQVITTSNDSTLYLTTAVATSAAGKTNTDTRSNVQGNAILGDMFTLPTGFATDITQLFNALLSLVMFISILLVFFYLISGSFQWITSGGDKGKIDQARAKMFAAIVGLIIVASSYAVFMVIIQFLGFNSFGDLFKRVDINSNTTILDRNQSEEKSLEELL